MTSSLIVAAVITSAMSVSTYAQADVSKIVRSDTPWVSLQHQRELEAQAIAKASKKLEDSQEIKAKKEQEKKNQNYLSRFTKSSKPQITADKFDYSADGTKLLATGNVVVYDKNFHINADSLEFAQKEGKASAHGDVQATVAELRLASNDIFMDMAQNAIKAQYSKFGSYPIFIETESVKGNKTDVELTASKIYFGDPSWCSMNANASSIKYNTQTELLEMEDVTLRIGKIPFFYVPSYSQYGLQKPPFSIQNRVGFNNDYGAYLRNTVLYNGLGDVDVGGLLDYYTKRSVLFGPAVRYDVNNTETWLKGFAQGAYINDNGGKDILGVDSLGRQITSDRFFSEIRHNQFIGENISITGNVSYWSDEFVTRDFRPEFFYENQTPDNFGEAMYYGEFFTTSVFTRFAPNDWEMVQQRLPEVRFDIQPIEIFNTGAYQNFYASYAYMREFDPYLSVADPEHYLFSNRIDAYYGISRPIYFNSWSTFTPVIGARVTSYANPNGDSSNYTRMLGQIGFDAQMDIWGTFDFNSEIMEIDGLRHHMIPMISYRYIPKAEQGKVEIPQIDTMYWTTYPPILDLGAMRNVDDMYDVNTVRFGIQNILETRDAEYGSRELARLDLYQDVNFTKRPLPQQNDEQSFSDLYLNGSISPARWLNVGTYFRYNIDHTDVPEINSYIGLLDGDEGSVYFVSSYLKGDINQYSVYADYKISERYKLLGRWHYDAKLSKFTDQTYGLWTRMGNSWIIEYYIAKRSGATRQDGYSFGVRATMYIF